jgi:glycosyltransferase involved in cell wall biosynthesis
MRVVIDALPMRGDSLSIVMEHLLEGWEQLHCGDDLHIIVGPDPQVLIPDSVTVHAVPFGRVPFASRLYAQSVVVPRLCRALGADVLLGSLPTTSVTRLPCPRAIMVYDLRHKLRPEQYSKKALALRKISYGIGFRQAEATACISQRTQDDLFNIYPHLASRPSRVAHLGADHADNWPVVPPDRPYAVAFAHYSNKNLDLALDAWALLHTRGEVRLPLVLVGLAAWDRPRVVERISALGLGDAVTVFPWLPIETFREVFASSSLVVFPSDFEGFGMPAAEAMRLGIPVVITPEKALLEITAGHATVMDDFSVAALVRAVDAAALVTPEQLAAATTHAQQFTWSNCAQAVRLLLADAMSAAGPARSGGIVTP